MKILLSILVLLVTTKECKSTKEQALDDSNAKNTEMILQSDMKVVYEAQSRGGFEHISISKDVVLISSDRYLKEVATYKCDENDWKAIYELLESIDTNTLSSLKAPTDKRLFDGAPHATLKLSKGDDEISTPTFDHGHPPKEIEALVNKVLSIKESLSKN